MATPPRHAYTKDQVCIYTEPLVPRKYPAAPARAAHVDEPKVAMSYRLSPAKIARAQRILGTPTATATIEEALDLVVFRRELTEGIAHAFGADVADVFPASARSKTSIRSKRPRRS